MIQVYCEPAGGESQFSRYGMEVAATTKTVHARRKAPRPDRPNVASIPGSSGPFSSGAGPQASMPHRIRDARTWNREAPGDPITPPATVTARAGVVPSQLLIVLRHLCDFRQSKFSTGQRSFRITD